MARGRQDNVADRHAFFVKGFTCWFTRSTDAVETLPALAIFHCHKNKKCIFS